MKRGLITWDKAEITPETFEDRCRGIQRMLGERGLPALAVYCDLWRSNQGRFFSNFMPYFNRALLVVPREGRTTLFCGLSPRVYNWIRSVTTIEDVRPAGNFAKPLFERAVEMGWKRIGLLDAEQFPFDIASALGAGPLEIVPVTSETVYTPGTDITEITMRRKAAALLRDVLAKEMDSGVGFPDHTLFGKLEGRLRRSGAEDLVLLVTNGAAPPAPASGQVLETNFSVSAALECRGHWVRVTRPQGTPDVVEACRREWEKKLSSAEAIGGAVVENLAGSYPYECAPGGAIFAVHAEVRAGHKRLFYGDTCVVADGKMELL